jgi:hypothetical protein
MKISFLALSLAASVTALHAEVVFQENFAYGPGVPERTQIAAGSAIKQSGITAANNVWQAPGFGEGVVFAPGGGLRRRS